MTQSSLYANAILTGISSRTFHYIQRVQNYLTRFVGRHKIQPLLSYLCDPSTAAYRLRTIILAILVHRQLRNAAIHICYRASALHSITKPSMTLLYLICPAILLESSTAGTSRAIPFRLTRLEDKRTLIYWHCLKPRVWPHIC